MKPDDAYLERRQYERVRTEAHRALQQAGGYGRFPTPVSDVMGAAHLGEAPEELDDGVLNRLRRLAGGALKRAASKVVGIFHASSRLVFIDRSLKKAKQAFLRLHETAHGLLPWQKDIYKVVEDCSLSLDPDVADLFDREANVFAAEVLFQLDGFIGVASQHEFGIGVPLKVGRRYGASAYASIREYVRKNPRPCAVLILNPPELIEGDGFVATLRRVEVSPAFSAVMGQIEWAERYTPGDPIGAMVPVGGRKMTGRRSRRLVDTNGAEHECVAEAFTQGFQVFVLFLVVGVRTTRLVA